MTQAIGKILSKLCILFIVNCDMNPEEMEITAEDYKNILALELLLRKSFHHVPFFIVAPSVIHCENIAIVKALFYSRDIREFIFKNPEKGPFLWENISQFELWKRGWSMRFQWIMQYFTISIFTILLMRFFQ